MDFDLCMTFWAVFIVPMPTLEQDLHLHTLVIAGSYYGRLDHSIDFASMFLPKLLTFDLALFP